MPLFFAVPESAATALPRRGPIAVSTLPLRHNTTRGPVWRSHTSWRVASRVRFETEDRYHGATRRRTRVISVLNNRALAMSGKAVRNSLF